MKTMTNPDPITCTQENTPPQSAPPLRETPLSDSGQWRRIPEWFAELVKRHMDEKLGTQ